MSINQTINKYILIGSFGKNIKPTNYCKTYKVKPIIMYFIAFSHAFFLLFYTAYGLPTASKTCQIKDHTKHSFEGTGVAHVSGS